MNDVQRAIDRLNRAIDLQEARAAAKAVAGMLVSLSLETSVPSDTDIDGWSFNACMAWGASVEALPSVIDYLETHVDG